MVMEELSIPYKVNFMELPEAKSEAFVKINPNGRLPAIKDPNTGVTLWEVCTKSISTKGGYAANHSVRRYHSLSRRSV